MSMDDVNQIMEILKSGGIIALRANEINSRGTVYSGFSVDGSALILRQIRDFLVGGPIDELHYNADIDEVIFIGNSYLVYRDMWQKSHAKSNSSEERECV